MKGEGKASRLHFTLHPCCSGREAVSDFVIRRGRFEQRLAPGFEPGVAVKFARALASYAEDDARLDAFVREEAAEHGRALPAGRREAEEVRGQQRVEQAREPRLHPRGVARRASRAARLREGKDARQRYPPQQERDGRDPRGHSQQCQRRARLARCETRGAQREARRLGQLSRKIHRRTVASKTRASVNIRRGRLALLIYPDSEEARERAARVVAGGGVVAFRTDT